MISPKVWAFLKGARIKFFGGCLAANGVPNSSCRWEDGGGVNGREDSRSNSSSWKDCSKLDDGFADDDETIEVSELMVNNTANPVSIHRPIGSSTVLSNPHPMLSSPLHQSSLNSLHNIHSLGAATISQPPQKMSQLSPSAGLSTTSSEKVVYESSTSALPKQSSKSVPTLTPAEKELNLANNTVRIGSRRSQLAVVQSEIVGASIQKHYPNLQTPIVKVSTLGDQMQNRPLYSFGGKAVWTKELETLLLEGHGEFDQIDMIVHSLKDMPTALPEEFELGCILQREDPRDALVMKKDSPYSSLSELPDGSIVGTSSVRRSAQLLKNHPNLVFKSIRGSLNTRISKLDAPDSEYSCIILAAAGLIRIDLGHRITKYLEADEMLYAVGQGALGIEIRKGDAKMKKVCEKLDCKITAIRCRAERELLRTLEGGCSVPVGVWTEYIKETETLNMKAVVLNPEGTQHVEKSLSKTVKGYDDATALGKELASMLINGGAKVILDAIDFDKINEVKQQGLTQV
ncbi:hypothetical protein OGAPHI_004854 [Ogataea philodendri]|uniref:Porphobilinogen deaminase n=1 Tax=Ogataea philodendri TaxID=1378263 RepID=A0A9P8P2M7_9ASCO|nr:uncharacterized protein OGAPHI_004854 [Ogataea philodendri]KAH3664140.1 hypothetical protein OGAPHI_004854 [Ogataea philodendri]